VSVPRADHQRQVGLRDHLIERTAALLARLVESDGEQFPYQGQEVTRLQQRLDDLKNGNDVDCYLFEIPPAWHPPRGDGRIRYVLRGDRLAGC
jgi:hypothetical protein